MPASEVWELKNKTETSMIKYKIFIFKTQGHYLIDILVLVIHTLIVSVLDIFSFYFDDELTF